MNGEVMFSSEKNFWETPQKLFDELDAEFHFTLDAAASDENHKCARYFTQNDDGLRQNWGGETVFCNPPYGSKETGLWTEKCYNMLERIGVSTGFTGSTTSRPSLSASASSRSRSMPPHSPMIAQRSLQSLTSADTSSGVSSVSS